MPELPEVETVVRSVRPFLVGEVIRHAEFRSTLVTRGPFDETARILAGLRIETVERHGKNILIGLTRGMLHVHLGMTGKLLWNGTPGKHTHVLLTTGNGTLLFDDIRKFGRFNFYESVPPGIASSGPDALSVTFDAFYAGLKNHSCGIKSLLLNQRFLSGLGNIYVDEVLFAARIHPRKVSARISRARALGLFQAIQKILSLAIRHRGSSISDYVDAGGKRGSFQQRHCVYGRTGQPCPVCGTAVRRIVIAQRGTHFCPVCQRS